MEITPTRQSAKILMFPVAARFCLKFKRKG